MTDVLETIEHKGYIVEVLADQGPMNPRENDNMGTILAYHQRYSLGDARPASLPSARDFDTQFDTWDDVARALVEREGAVVVLPVYLYDHSGLALRCGPEWNRPISQVGGKGGADRETLRAALHGGNPFVGRAHHAEWDSGMVGFIYTTRARIDDCMGTGATRISATLRERVVSCLKAEIEEYSAYVNGEAYGYRVLDQDGEEIEDVGTWGYLGSDGWNYAISEATHEIDAIITQAQAAEWSSLAALPVEAE